MDIILFSLIRVGKVRPKFPIRYLQLVQTRERLKKNTISKDINNSHLLVRLSGERSKTVSRPEVLGRQQGVDWHELHCSRSFGLHGISLYLRGQIWISDVMWATKHCQTRSSKFTVIDGVMH